VTIESIPSRLPSVHLPERPSSESNAFRALLAHCAQRLEHDADMIARRWTTQALQVESREADEGEGAGDRAAAGAALIRALGRALAADAGTSEDAVSIGLAYGADAFSGGASLHHMLKGLDLLEAMVLFAVEGDLASQPREGLGLAAGVQLARRLRRFSSLAVMAAAKGYTQAVSDEMRDRFRHLRHDLRNPLGTIKSVLALMDDQSIPADARAHPRFRAMAARNARTLDELIAARLSDAEALLPALAHQRVSLRTIACSVRRELRAEADRRGVTVVIGPAVERVRVDAVGVELLLHELLHAALHDADEGEELRITFGPLDRARIALRMEGRTNGAPIGDARAFSRLAALAGRIGATLHRNDVIVLVLPVHVHSGDVATDADAADVGLAVERDVDAPIATADARGELRGGQTRHDVGGASERENRQPRLE
jgi:signal transduction histidine kinase